jgi:hypothetical protein
MGCLEGSQADLKRPVRVHPERLWRLRVRSELPRIALLALALFGLGASARYALFPPAAKVIAAPAAAPADRAAEAFAASFARRYLSYNASNPQGYAEALAPYFGAEGGAGSAGVVLPSSGAQEAIDVEVAQERSGPAGERVYTLACTMSDGAMLYLSVGVLREPSGALALAGYPAFVGPPESAPWTNPVEAFRSVEDSALQTVVRRALHNYLAGAMLDLQADLSAGARVSLPPQPLQLEALQSLRWLPGGGSVIALVKAHDAHGARYTLAYELDVVEVAGRWEIAAIQMNPDQP